MAKTVGAILGLATVAGIIWLAKRTSASGGNGGGPGYNLAYSNAYVLPTHPMYQPPLPDGTYGWAGVIYYVTVTNPQAEAVTTTLRGPNGFNPVYTLLPWETALSISIPLDNVTLVKGVSTTIWFVDDDGLETPHVTIVYGGE